MDKTEFLEILKSRLSGQMPEGKVAAHVRYYRDYIEEQVKNGRSEREILAELGDPRLIAKTLVDADPDEEQEVYDGGRVRGDGYGGSGYERTDKEHVKHHTYKLDLSTWYGKAIVIAAAALIIIGLVVIIGTVLPFIIVACLVLYLISWLRKR